MNAVLSGLDVLVRQGFASLAGKRVGLLTHPAAVDVDFRSATELFAHAPNLELVTLFGPEHGLLGQAQDLMGVPSGHARAGDVRVVSLYGDSIESLKPTSAQLHGLDILVIDLQDIGSRYYTFQATMRLCQQAASAIGLPVCVLDRPNPLGGTVVEGPTIQPGYDSFVGIHPLPTRHGLTIGELARLYHSELSLTNSLTVVPCAGWRRAMDFETTGLPWVLPSPNMPTLDTAFVYPGQCLLEGTNLSEGRGTTRPFELCGLPALDPRSLADRLRTEDWPGVAFRPAWFQPTFQKYAGQLCGGIQVHVTDRAVFQPVRVGLATLLALRDAAGARFDWRRQAYEFVTDRLAIDLLFGSPRERLALESGQAARQIATHWENEEADFRKRRQAFLMYD